MVDFNDIEIIRKSKGDQKRIGKGGAGDVYLARMKLRYENDNITAGEYMEVAVKQFAVHRSMRLIAYLWPTVVLPINTDGQDFISAFGDAHCVKLGKEDALTLDCCPVRIQMILTVMDTVKKVQGNAPDKIVLKSLLYMHYTRDGITSYEAANDELKFVPNTQAFPVDGHTHLLFHDVPEISRVHSKVVTEFIEKELTSS